MVFGMTEGENGAKTFRLLTMADLLREGKRVKKSELARRFQVTERSVQRDLEDLRCFFAEQDSPGEVLYDPRSRGYCLTHRNDSALTNSEVLAVCKILLESRSMPREEMLPLLDKLVERCVPEENKRAVGELIANEKFHYIEPHHGRSVLNGLWDMGRAVRDRRVMEIEYERMKEPRLVKRTVEPVGLMFSEYYFYLTAFLRDVDRSAEFDNADDLFPTIYRIDRIRSFKVLDERFSVPYKDRFQEGEFRKRVQFMYGGKLERIRFRYTGPSIEAVLDRLPTAEIVSQDDEGWTVQAEVFGKGIEMWLRSQGEYIQKAGDTHEP